MLFLSALAACAEQPACDATRTLYVVSHGWHSGVVVGRADLASRLPGLALGEASHVEIGWGEERFYQARETTIGMALRAVLQPNASVLQVVPLSGSPRGYFAGSDVTEVGTDEAGRQNVDENPSAESALAQARAAVLRELLVQQTIE